jgi:TonB family protein
LLALRGGESHTSNANLCVAGGSLRLDPLTKTAGIYLCAFGFALSDSAIAAQPRLVDEELVAEGKIDIRPEYPAEAQAQRLTGTGVFVLHVDPKNGQVSSIDIEKSTGHKLLDDAAVKTFGNLQFKRHIALRVKIPVTYVMPRPRDEVPRTRGFPATALFQNERPVFPSHGRTGGGR